MQVENKSSLIFDFVYRLLFEEISSVLYIDAYIHSLSELPHSTPNDLEGTVSVSVVVRREHRMYKLINNAGCIEIMRLNKNGIYLSHAEKDVICCTAQQLLLISILDALK
jgi:hypothetical protein